MPSARRWCSTPGMPASVDAISGTPAPRSRASRLVPEAGFELVALPSRQIMGTSLLARLRALPAMLSACAAAWRVLGARRVEIVVSVGGYASVPAALAAVLRRIPLVLVEPNAAFAPDLQRISSEHQADDLP